MSTATPATQTSDQYQSETFGGHPTSLYMLFFAEMWERFSYYGMRALLVLYMIKGFMQRNDSDAYAIYGAYTALVYATPFIGGMLADKILGARRAVILGGLLMALGHLIMTIESEQPFYYALAFLIVGNGFFKPNISTIVGSLYPEGSPQRDAGFTVFYIGINLGAAMAPLLCGYVGENYGWHYGFGLATIGMLVGLLVFVAPRSIGRILILLTALASGGAMIYFNLEKVIFELGPNALVALCLMASGVIAFLALAKAGLPSWAGAAPSDDMLKNPLIPGIPLRADLTIYLGAFLVTPLLAIFVQRNELAGSMLTLFGVGALVYLLAEMSRSTKIERERLQVVLVLMFFSMLFWAFFEQAGSSMNMFTDRNVNRVISSATITPEQVGSSLEVEVSQGLTGYPHFEKPNQIITMTDVDAWKESHKRDDGPAMMQITPTQKHVGMSVQGSEVATSQFQAANPIFIIFFGLAFSALWGWLGRQKLEPSTPTKFGLGILQLGAGFGVLWYTAIHPDARGMVSMGALLLSYLLITTGELCLSPVGLSMITKLAPKRIVSMVMGAWFLATAFSNYLSALIATFTGVTHDGEGPATLPPPTETAQIYADVFGPIALAACLSAVVVFALVPLLNRWMHEEEDQVA